MQETGSSMANGSAARADTLLDHAERRARGLGLVRIKCDNPGTDDLIRVASRAAEGARLISCSLGGQTRHGYSCRG